MGGLKDLKALAGDRRSNLRSILWPGTLGEVRRYLLALALLAALFLVALNGLVRLAGGEPHLLSPRFVPEKVKALSLLVAHGPAHLFGSRARSIKSWC
jgi:hypothetical protein